MLALDCMLHRGLYGQSSHNLYPLSQIRKLRHKEITHCSEDLN